MRGIGRLKGSSVWASPGPAGQLIAGLGALVALYGLTGPWPAGIGSLMLVIGVVVSAPAAARPGPYMVEWWRCAALGALAAMIGFGLGFVVGWLGGLILAAGAVAVIIAVVFGSPVQTED